MASRRARRVTDELNRFVERVMRRLELRCFQALTSASPVDTGFFRAGWIPSTGAPQPGPPSPQGGADLARAQARTLFATNQQLASQIASSYTLSEGPIFIVNAVRYGVFLNAGSSAQAPAMFVEQAIETAVAQTRREIPSN